MIIYESLLKASGIFEAARAVAKIVSSLKSNHHDQVKPVQNPWHTL